METGIQVPEWLDELWGLLLQKTVRALESKSKRENWATKGEFSVYSESWVHHDKMLRMDQAKIPSISLRWQSKERNKEVLSSVDKNKAYAGRTDLKEYIDIVIPDADFEKMTAALDSTNDHVTGAECYEVLSKYKSTFLHELTHYREHPKEWNKRKKDREKYHKEKHDTSESSIRAHKLMRTEWRAYLAQIRHELQKEIKWGYTPASDYDAISDLLKRESTTWNQIEAYLPPAGRKYIMQAIGRDVLEAREQKSTVSKERIQFKSWSEVTGLLQSASIYFGVHSPEYRVIARFIKNWEYDFNTQKKNYPEEVNTMDDMLPYINDSIEDTSLYYHQIITNWIKLHQTKWK